MNLTMQHRRLGDTDLECSVVGLGTGRLASVSAGVSSLRAGRLMDAAADLGINMIDTADSYAQGACERLLGDLLRGRRDRFLLATKAGYCFPDLPPALRMAAPFVKKIVNALTRRTQNFTPHAIERCVEASLKRLQTDRIDLFFLHTPDVRAMGNGALLEMLRGLKKQGKIRHFGVSSHDPEVLRAACRTEGVTAVQAPVNPCFRDTLAALPELNTARIGAVANRVFLSGKLLAPGVDDAPLRERIERLRSARGATASRLLMQFALAQPGVACALSGTTDAEHLKQNVADALDTGTFTREEIASLG